MLYKSIISDTSTSNMRTNFYPQLPHMLCVHMLCWCVHAWYVSPIYLWGDVPILVKGLQSTAENCPPLLQQRQQLILQLVTLCMWVKVSTQQGWGKGGGRGGELQYLRLLYQPTSLFKSNYASISHCFHCLVLMNGLKKLHSWFMSRRTCAPWWYSMNNTDQGHKRVWISGWVNLPRSGGFCICEMSVPKPSPWITTNDAYKIKTHFLLNFVRHIVHINPRPPQATKAH